MELEVLAVGDIAGVPPEALADAAHRLHVLRGEQLVGRPHPDDEEPLFFGSRVYKPYQRSAGPTIGGRDQADAMPSVGW